jgi:lipoprotein NlpI
MATIRLFLVLLLAIANVELAYANGLDDGSAGLVAAQRGDFDEAIRLFTAAIASRELSPRNNVLAYHNRGNTYQDKENYGQAIADYSTVIRLQPDYAQAWYSRGRAQFALGMFAAAITDLAHSIALDPSDEYSVLWLHLARSNTARVDVAELERNSTKLDLASWPGPLVNLYLGKITSGQARAASAGGDADTQIDRKCEAAFFIGEYELLRKEVATAKTQFQDALKSCPYTSDERDGAVAELQRMH